VIDDDVIARMEALIEWFPPEISGTTHGSAFRSAEKLAAYCKLLLAERAAREARDRAHLKAGGYVDKCPSRDLYRE